MSELGKFIRENETRFMERILQYAKTQGYAEYTSTLLEAWRVSIVGLSDAIVDALAIHGDELPQFSPHDRFEENPIADFGVREAYLHRKRGISLQMFLGLYKYYRYAFEDIIEEMEGSVEEKIHRRHFVERVFDLIEIAFCSEWSGLNSDNVILELQQSSREMTNEKNKYLTLFESLAIPAFLIDANGSIGNLNHAAVLMLVGDLGEGVSYYGDDDLKKSLPIGKSLGDIIPWVSGEIGEFLRGDFFSEHFEKTHRNSEGLYYYSVRFARMKDVSGKFEGGVVTVEDISGRKQMETQLAQVRKLESVGQLAAGIAHEINTPIQFLSHNISFIEEAMSKIFKTNQEAETCSIDDELDFFKQEMPTVIKESKEGLDRVSTIVQAFNKFAHPDQSSLARIDLNDVVENVVEITRNEWKHVAEIKTEFSDDLGLIEVVRGEINQIVLNIVMNAIHAVRKKFGEENKSGLITLRTVRRDSLIEISVRDNGCGVAEDIKHRLYDPYFTTKDVGEGAGQGLYIVHTLTAKNHGEVLFHSEEGEGAEFFVRFPKSE